MYAVEKKKSLFENVKMYSTHAYLYVFIMPREN
jgi:hypothetical protein